MSRLVSFRIWLLDGLQRPSMLPSASHAHPDQRSLRSNPRSCTMMTGKQRLRLVSLAFFLPQTTTRIIEGTSQAPRPHRTRS